MEGLFPRSVSTWTSADEAICRLWFYILTGTLSVLAKNSLQAKSIVVVLWSFQVQLLPQIIANRLALIMTNPRKALALKLGLLISITPICLCVCYMWTVAQLEGATDSQKRRNFVFEKFEKTFFLITDFTLNIYFLFLVHHKLIASGLTKYSKLFNFNIGMVMVSTSLDALLLGFLSLPNGYVWVWCQTNTYDAASDSPRYVQYSSAAYISKLYIELVMVSLISKIIRRSVNDGNIPHFTSYDAEYSRSDSSKHYNGTGSIGWMKQGRMKFNHVSSDKPEATREGSSGSEIHLTTYDGLKGITKTIEHTVVVESPWNIDNPKKIG